MPRSLGKIPRANLEIPRIGGNFPLVSPELPRIEEDMPRIRIEIPQVSLYMPRVNLEIPQVTLHLPQVDADSRHFGTGEPAAASELRYEISRERRRDRPSTSGSRRPRQWNGWRARARRSGATADRRARQGEEIWRHPELRGSPPNRISRRRTVSGSRRDRGGRSAEEGGRPTTRERRAPFRGRPPWGGPRRPARRWPPRGGLRGSADAPSGR